MNHHSFHNFQTFFKRNWVERSFLLRFKGCDSLFFCFFFGFLGGLLYISVENLPLSDFKGKVFIWWGFSRNTLFSNMIIQSLSLSFIVVKFISQSFFDGVNIFFRSSGVFSFVVSDGFFNEIVSDFEDFFLHSGLITRFKNNVSFEFKMNLKLVR